MLPCPLPSKVALPNPVPSLPQAQVRGYTGDNGQPSRDVIAH